MYENHKHVVTMIASEDMDHDGSIGKAVAQVSNVNFKVAYAQAGGGFGVLKNLPKAGEAASIVREGEVQVRVGLAVQASQYAMVANSGWFINVASTTSAQIMGRYMTSAASGMLATLSIEKFRGATA